MRFGNGLRFDFGYGGKDAIVSIVPARKRLATVQWLPWGDSEFDRRLAWAIVRSRFEKWVRKLWLDNETALPKSSALWTGGYGMWQHCPEHLAEVVFDIAGIVVAQQLAAIVRDIETRGEACSLRRNPREFKWTH